MITPPTCEDLLDAYTGTNIVSVHREVDDSWRHGSYVTEVFRRIPDDTFWEAYYRLSTDGETHELREGCAVITRVVPEERKVLVYVPFKE